MLVTTSSSVFATQAKPTAAKTTPANGAQVMRYDVYAGGFHVVNADFIVDTAKKTNYFVKLAAHTQGMLADLVPWKGTFESKGWYDAKAGSPYPEIHKSVTWDGEDEVKEYRYKKDGTFVDYRLKNKENDGSPKPVESELTKDTTDAFSAGLRVMAKIAQDGKCEGADDVFDGSRRFRQVFVHQGETVLKANEYNVYSGPAIECTVEVKPVAGKWHDKPRGWLSIQEQGRAKGTMPTIWFATLAPGQPAVPVKIRIKTDYGTLFMHLTHYNGGGKTLDLPQED